MTTTVLDIVQSVLSSMDSDEVNAIGDTLESSQVAEIVTEVFDDIVDQYDLPAKQELFQLTGLGLSAKPTLMQLPSTVSAVEWIKYDIRATSGDDPKYVDIPYWDPHSFLERSYALKESDSNVLAYAPTDSTAEVLIRTNTKPTKWTTFDDEYIIFDAIDTDEFSTLEGGKTSCFGTRRASITTAGETVIPLPDQLIGLLRNEVRELAWDLWKDGATPKTNQAARRSRVRAQRNKNAFSLRQPADNLPDYGRKGRKTRDLDGTNEGVGTPLPSWWPT